MGLLSIPPSRRSKRRKAPDAVHATNSNTYRIKSDACFRAFGICTDSTAARLQVGVVASWGGCELWWQVGVAARWNGCGMGWLHGYTAAWLRHEAARWGGCELGWLRDGVVAKANFALEISLVLHIQKSNFDLVSTSTSR